jgi:hypothetical protein
MPAQATVNKNFDIELDCTWKEGDTQQYYGLILGKNADNHIRFLLTREGGAMANMLRDGNFISPTLIPPKIRSKVPGGIGTTEHIVVRVRSGELSFFADEEKIGVFKLPTDLSIDIFGLIVEDRQTVSFNRIAIYAR